MRFVVESWAPEYGAASDGDAALAEAAVPVRHELEVPIEQWAPRTPDGAVPVPATAVLVDGVRRIDAHLWITGADGAVAQGLCASYGAGAVRCDGAATVEACEVRRGLFTAHPDAAPVQTRHGTYDVHLAADDDPEVLSLRLQQCMSELEQQVAGAAGPAEVVVIDGPLRAGHTGPATVGYVKTHRRAYGAPVVREVVAALAVGQRTPLFLIEGPRPRVSWYLRLPCERRHALDGVVRLEVAADLEVGAAAALADGLARLLPRFASSPHKDPRAPQNLVPIGGLEHRLRHRLGDATLLLRALRVAAEAGPVTPRAG